MIFCGLLRGELVLIAACVICGNFAQTPCTTDGWFGPNCQYQCHCADSSTCDKVDGSCSSGCHSDWFGPDCQYNRATFTASSGLWWLTDNSDTTCNSGSSQPVTVNLNTAIPLTWVRVVLNNAAYLNHMEIKYNSPLQTCPDLRTAKVDDVTLDIYCPTVKTVNQITLSGLGVTKLCALYISGGRNVALKQPTQQSTRYEVPEFPGHDFFLAEYAVDGRVGDGSYNSSRLTCTHTDIEPSPDWWTVNFTQAVDIIRFIIYNRNNVNNIVRLIGFTLTAQPKSSTTATPYTYTDSQHRAQASYLIVPSSKISFPVSQVRVEAGPTSRILTLCEVFVFGEFDCPSGTFGLSCERQCNCAGGGRTCFIHSGGCPGGCATNYDGEDCYDCAAGKYGANCDQDCSVHCGGDNSCDRNTGVCNYGCDPGYTGDRCISRCNVGYYGARCNSRCSSNCAGSDNACHHVTGVCDSCFPGKYSSNCSISCSVNCGDNACDRDTGNCECDTGHWGHTCLNDCSKKCAGQDHACSQIDGACMTCPLGYYGNDCLSKCSVNCGGSNKACNITNGNCDEGCVPGYRGAICNEFTALQQSGESGESSLNIWGISVTIIAAAAVIVIGLLVWRLLKCAKERSSTLTNNGIEEGGTQRSGQQGIPNINSPNQRYDLVQVGPEDVNLYNEGFDHYDSPLDLMRRTGDYETPQPVVITGSNQDYVEGDNVPSVGRTAESSSYVNTL